MWYWVVSACITPSKAAAAMTMVTSVLMAGVCACVCLPYGWHVMALFTVTVSAFSVAAVSDANGTEETPHNA